MTSFTVRMFHAAAVLECYYSLYIYYKFTGMRKSTYGGDWKYLTFINLQIKAIYFIICFIHDVVELFSGNSMFNNVKTKIFKVKEIMYTTLTLPTTIMVFGMFWGLYAIDRELIYPASFDKIFPAYANHLWHTTILIVVLEVATCHHIFPGPKISFVLTTLFSVLYALWIVWLEKVGGVSVYPVLAKLDGIFYLAFLLVSQLLVQLSFVFGKFLNKITDQIFGFKPALESKNK